MKFENKVVVITGSAKGIGFAIAEKFAKKGATTIITDVNQEIVDAAVNKIRNS